MWRPPPSLGALPRRATDGGHGRRPALPRSGAAAFATARGAGHGVPALLDRDRHGRGSHDVGASRAPNVTRNRPRATKDALDAALAGLGAAFRTIVQPPPPAA